MSETRHTLGTGLRAPDHDGVGAGAGQPPPSTRSGGPARPVPARLVRSRLGSPPWGGIGEDVGVPSTIHELQDLLRDRRVNRPSGSYSASLFDDPERIQRKIMEESFEVCLELGRSEPDLARVAAEAADLVFHLLVGLVDAGVDFDEVVAELAARRR